MQLKIGKLGLFIPEVHSCLGCIDWIRFEHGTKFISPCSLKQWLAQWIEDPKF